MRPDPDQAARHRGRRCWRVVYHHTDPAGANRAETIIWFATTEDAAWVEAAAQLPPTGYHRPDTVTVEPGTFTPLPEGGHGWQPTGPPQRATVDHHGITTDEDDRPEPPATPGTDHAAATAAGQQPLF